MVEARERVCEPAVLLGQVKIQKLVAFLRCKLGVELNLTTSLLQVLMLLAHVLSMDIPSVLVKPVVKVFVHVLAVVF
jgi:hypothetical protein